MHFSTWTSPAHAARQFAQTLARCANPLVLAHSVSRKLLTFSPYSFVLTLPRQKANDAGNKQNFDQPRMISNKSALIPVFQRQLYRFTTRYHGSGSSIPFTAALRKMIIVAKGCALKMSLEWLVTAYLMIINSWKYSNWWISTQKRINKSNYGEMFYSKKAAHIHKVFQLRNRTIIIMSFQCVYCWHRVVGMYTCYFECSWLLHSHFEGIHIFTCLHH